MRPAFDFPQAFFQFFAPSLQRPQDGRWRGSQPALQDGQGESYRAPFAACLYFCPVEFLADIPGDRLVESRFMRRQFVG